jgi:hypothetical protein
MALDKTWQGCKEFGRYLRLVFKSWWAYIGAPMGVLRLIEKWRGTTTHIPHSIMAIAAIFGVFVAQWRAYKSLLNIRSDRVRQLTSLLDEGRVIRQGYAASMSGSAFPKWERQHVDWQERVKTFLSAKMGPLALAKFSHDTGLPEYVNLGMFSAPHPWFDRELDNLMEIIERIDYYSA